MGRLFIGRRMNCSARELARFSGIAGPKVRIERRFGMQPGPAAGRGVRAPEPVQTSGSAWRQCITSNPELSQRLAFDEFPGLVEVIANLHVGVDAE